MLRNEVRIVKDILTGVVKILKDTWGKRKFNKVISCTVAFAAMTAISAVAFILTK